MGLAAASPGKLVLLDYQFSARDAARLFHTIDVSSATCSSPDDVAHITEEAKEFYSAAAGPLLARVLANLSGGRQFRAVVRFSCLRRIKLL